MFKLNLEVALTQALQDYLAHLEGEEPDNLHTLVISSVERTLVHATLQLTGNNKSKAATWLGISRNTLRKITS